MVPGEVSDDVALLAVRQLPVSADGFHMRVLAEPPMVSRVRRSLFRWLSSNGVPREIADEIVLASSEAVTNSIRHAYGPGDGWVEVDASFAGGHVEVDVRDDGRWRPPRGEEGGRGLEVIRACMSEVSIEPGSAGTRVRMRRMAPTQASP
jgi:anti-sigma regulatory factor (Ser/Thr protein kinase)